MTSPSFRFLTIRRVSTRLLACLLIALGSGSPAAPVQANSLSPLFDTTAIVGARVDETSIKTTILVDPRARSGPGIVATISDAFELAYAQLQRGVPIRIRIASGTYRESAPTLDWTVGKARDTLLVIEAAEGAEVVWSGSDIYPLAEWMHEGGGLYSHAWAHAFGSWSPYWGPPGVIAHRSEMIFVNGWPLKQVLLETYKTNLDDKGHIESRPRAIEWNYDKLLDSRTTVPVGGFGVAEREENGRKLYLRLPKGVRPASAPLIEVSTRRALLDLFRKNQVVLRGITFQHVATAIKPRRGIDSPVAFGSGPADSSSDILIERCRFLWNNTTGLEISGSHWTVRQSEASYNGWCGFSSGWPTANIVLEGNTTNFSTWRGFMGGESGWSTAGAKFHYVKGMTVFGHTAIGNLTGSFGYDIHCEDIYNEDIVALENRNGVLWELSKGPFHGRRILSAAQTTHGGQGMRIWDVGQALLEDSILHGNPQVPDWPAAFATVTSIKITGRLGETAEKAVSPDRFFPLLGVTIRNTITAGGPRQTALVVNEAYGRADHRQPVSLAYTGENNLYWSEAVSPEVFRLIRRDFQSEKESVSFDLAAWEKRFDEKGAEWADPRFEDVEARDYRLRSDSPWRNRADRLPSYRMPVLLRADLVRFREWVNAKPVLTLREDET